MAFGQTAPGQTLAGQAMAGQAGAAETSSRTPVAKVPFHIAPESLADALVDFAVQAHVSIGYSGVDFHGAIANPVEGNFTPDVALKLILAGTGYESVARMAEALEVRQIVSASAAAAMQSGAPAIGAGDAARLEELVVTSTKRAEIAQSLPYSISVVTGADLDHFGLRSQNDLMAHVAAFSVTDFGVGQNKLAIRGLSDSAIPGRSQSVVGLYLDESRLTDDAPDPGLRLVDIDRVEVVRGPQGTLYGAGTLGGLVRVITNKPILDGEQGMAMLSTAAAEEGGPSAGIDLMLNLPLVKHVLALRAVGYVRRDGGYIDEARLSRHDTNLTDTDGGRLSLLWQLSDDWSVAAGFTGQQIAAADSQYFQAGLGFLQRMNFELEPHRDQFLQANLTVEGLLDWAKVTSTTAFTERRITDQYDASLAWTALTGFPMGPARFGDMRNIQSVTQETRLTSLGAERFNWIAGTFLSHRNEGYRARLVGPDARHQPFIARAQVRNDYADELALFGEATYDLTDSLSVTAGLRGFYASLNAAADVGRPMSIGSTLAEGTNHTTGFVPKLIVSYNPAKILTLYADAAEGFRLGGVNINSPIGAINVNRPRSGRQPVSTNARTFDSDRLWSYEVGAKTALWDGRLVANAAGYLTVWDNIQSDQILRDGSLYTANAGTTHAPGFEIDVNVQATRHLRLQGNFFWNDPDILHPNPLLIQSAGRLPAVPISNFGLSARYSVSIQDGWDASASLEYAYVGEETLGFDARNSPTMGDYSNVDARVGLTRGVWEATLYVKNLMDEGANVFAFGNPFNMGAIGQATPLRPRTIGVDLSWSY
ncbi:MAG: TonB-dependent receptor [Rhodospirillales bacterium]|nr:TonB-dependent receptor [Rhodospirillales bacterium]